MTITPKLAAGLIGLAVSLPLDLITKWLVNRHLVYGDRHPVIEGFFYLTHVRNTGAAFGLFSEGPSEIRLVFFVGVSVIAIGIILSFFRKLGPGEWVSALALGFILGGALGNLRDRIAYGEVVDFLHFRLWGGYSWPDFNFADSFIVVGVAILVLELLASEGETSGAADGGGESSA